MKTIFKVFSDGDPSVGIWGLNASVTIEDNYGEHDELFIEDWRIKIAQMYEDEIGLKVYTEKEWKDELEEEKKFFGEDIE